MKHWRHYLEGSRHTVKVLTDHKNLEIFMSTKILNQRQARWAELLADYDFVLEHIPGKTNPADGPSRCPDYVEDATEVEDGAIFPQSAFRCLDIPAVRRQHMPQKDLRQRLIQALAKDKVANEHKQEVDQPTKKRHKLWSWDDGLPLFDYLIYVPD